MTDNEVKWLIVGKLLRRNLMAAKGEQWEVLWETVYEDTLSVTRSDSYNGYRQVAASIVVSGWLFKTGDKVRLTANGMSTIYTVGEYVSNGYYVGNRWLGEKTTATEFVDDGSDFCLRNTRAITLTATTYHLYVFARNPGTYNIKIERMVS